MAAGLLLHHLREAGHDASVTSVGTRAFSLPVDPVAVGAVGDIGVDISGHIPRQMDRALLDSEGADLIVTMTREHLRVVVASHRTTFPRTFTLRELLRRASANGRSDGSWEDWLTSIAAGRRASDLMGDEGHDDIADPYGLGRGKVAATASELDVLTRQLALTAPW
ncbi:MAG: protein tyrosine phosphatase [Ilumatobacteraceae bacterium]|nr:protein tyrosine phosphatase [Ilumatobacteraceae bacterium]MCU1389464.1 protein tyrosine phosphatase [Ilumatobacteraceae bacterium]